MEKEICECKRDYKSPLSGICELCWDEKYPDEEETLEEVAANLADPNLCKTDNLIAGAKWQQERMYSEEDLRKAFNCAREFNSLDGVVDVHIVLPMGGDMSDLQPLHFTFEEWLKQFKKK